MYINKAKVINAYGKTEQASNLTKNSFEVVASILDELKRSMIIVSEISEKKKPEDKEREKSNSNFSRACIAIYALQTSLDFEKGGYIAIQLFQVYFSLMTSSANLSRQEILRYFSIFLY